MEINLETNLKSAMLYGFLYQLPRGKNRHAEGVFFILRDLEQLIEVDSINFICTS